MNSYEIFRSLLPFYIDSELPSKDEISIYRERLSLKNNFFFGET